MPIAIAAIHVPNITTTSIGAGLSPTAELLLPPSKEVSYGLPSKYFSTRTKKRDCEISQCKVADAAMSGSPYVYGS